MALYLNKLILNAMLILIINFILSYKINISFLKYKKNYLTVVLFLLLLCPSTLILIKINKFIVFVLLQLLAYRYFIGKKYNYIELINQISLLFNFNLFIINYSLINLLLLIEINNIVLIILVLLQKKKIFSYKKKIYILFITTNIIFLTLFSVFLLYITNIFNSTNFQLCLYLLILKKQWFPLFILNFIFLLKLGLVLGPRYNLHIYKELNHSNLTTYLYYSYIMFPLVLIPYIQLIPCSVNMCYLIISLIVCLNIKTFIFENKTNLLFYYSNQINLVYINIIFI